MGFGTLKFYSRSDIRYNHFYSNLFYTTAQVPLPRLCALLRAYFLFRRDPPIAALAR